MEPTAGVTHHEDIYGISQLEEDRVESYAFDLCEGSDDDEDDDEGGGNIDETPSKRRWVISGSGSGSRGQSRSPRPGWRRREHEGRKWVVVWTA